MIPIYYYTSMKTQKANNQNKNFLEFISILTNIKDKHEMKNLLEGLLTPKEMQELPVRIQIIKLIKKGMSHKKIAEKLGVGVATVTRGSKEIQKGNFKCIK